MAGISKNPDDYPKEHMGRPSKFTKDRRDAIIDAIFHRIPYELAAQANGISEKTLYNWLDTALLHEEEGIDSEYTEFLQGIKKAEMQRIRQHSDIIADRPERWQADAWLLERRWHKFYSPNASIIELNQRMAKIEHGGSTNEGGRKTQDGE